jgi:hypothetical protein
VGDKVTVSAVVAGEELGEELGAREKLGAMVVGEQMEGAIDFFQPEGDGHAGAAAHAFFFGSGDDPDFTDATVAAVHSFASGAAPQTSVRSALFLPPPSRRAPPDQTSGAGLGAGASHAGSSTVRDTTTEPALLPLEFLEPLPLLDPLEAVYCSPLAEELQLGYVEAGTREKGTHVSGFRQVDNGYAIHKHSADYKKTVNNATRQCYSP